MFKFTCSECNSSNVSSKCWANPNNDEIGDYVSSEAEDNYCEDCEKHVELNTEEAVENCGICKNALRLKTIEVSNEIVDRFVCDNIACDGYIRGYGLK